MAENSLLLRFELYVILLCPLYETYGAWKVKETNIEYIIFETLGFCTIPNFVQTILTYFWKAILMNARNDSTEHCKLLSKCSLHSKTVFRKEANDIFLIPIVSRNLHDTVKPIIEVFYISESVIYEKNDETGDNIASPDFRKHCVSDALIVLVSTLLTSLQASNFRTI